MRFMMLVKASKESEAGVMPTEQELLEMGKFNQEMADAGVMLAGEGLHPSSRGARVRFSTGAPTVIDGPFPETKELLAGFWIIQAASWDEALDWARRVPFKDGELEVRQIFELEDFGEAATPEVRETQERLRRQTAAK